MPVALLSSVLLLLAAPSMAKRKSCRKSVTSLASPARLSNPIGLVRRHTHDKTYIYTDHAKLRLRQRRISPEDVRWVLRHGRYNDEGDLFKKRIRAWSYAIEGNLRHGRRRKTLKVVVTFHKGKMLIVTVRYVIRRSR